MKKYCIALLPSTTSDDFIDFSQKLPLTSIKYQLGPNSYPHVTLKQFYANESQIEETWNDVCGLFDSHQLHIEFKIFSCITFDEINFWVSLLPDERLELIEMNSKISKLIASPSSRAYDPHLTLISTLDLDYQTKMDPSRKTYKPISDDFILALGECDELGQFTKIVFQSSLTERLLHRV